MTIALMAAFAAFALPAAAQTAAKPAADKKPATAKAAGRNPKLARGAQKAVEENTPIDDDPSIQIGEKELAVAREVQTGDMPCELGASVKVTPSKREGLFLVTTKGYRFLMHPVDSRTGAIRLEDAKRGAMWLQLGNKSMLMSQKLGQRLADECQSPRQAAFAEELKRNPRPSILDAPAPAASAPVAAASAAAAAASASAAPASAPAAGMAPASNPAIPAAAAAASAPRAN
ncbi:hypothetical protein [Ramlibacter humi]|uniref:hypothetical protein n=1 Tax=Ramlibacter humi TaxID=2530451 RepID=UPI001EF14393|nr:hypothetical protein [Ramlibacter humi]